MSGLLGEPIGSIKHPQQPEAFQQSPESVAAYLTGTSAKECVINYDGQCFDENDDRAWRRGCKAGFVGVGVAHGTNVPKKRVCKVRKNYSRGSSSSVIN
jgi:hypothetical protein